MSSLARKRAVILRDMMAFSTVGDVASLTLTPTPCMADRFYAGVNFEPPGPCADTAEIYAHSRTLGFGHEVKKRILLGTYALTAA